VGKGYFFERAKNLKISNFVCQSYLRDFLRQFPLKTPGPISPTTLEQNKKQKQKFTRGVFTWVGKGHFFERANI
jgi:hypothetical protein